MLWITSDHHIGDKRFEILDRPFEDVGSYIQHLVTQHNKLVKPEDVVLILGDFIYDNHYLELIQAFNGKKILVRGNNDSPTDDQYRENGIRMVVPEGSSIYFGYDYARDQMVFNEPQEAKDYEKYFATHYPQLAIPDLFNLVGHIHGAWKVQKNMLNVSLDCHHWRPIPMKRVRFFQTAIANYYDNDVWISNHPANEAHKERGKAGTYWDRRLKEGAAPPLPPVTKIEGDTCA